jgi:hypothetical protein
MDREDVLLRYLDRIARALEVTAKLTERMTVAGEEMARLTFETVKMQESMMNAQEADRKRAQQAASARGIRMQ